MFACFYLVQWMILRKLPQGGHTAQFRHHMGPHIMGDQLVTLEVCAMDPHLRQHPITAGVRGQEDRIQRTRFLLELKEKNIIDVMSVLVTMAGFPTCARSHLDGDGHHLSLWVKVEEAQWGRKVRLLSIYPVTFKPVQNFIVQQINVSFLSHQKHKVKIISHKSHKSENCKVT